MLLGVLFDFNGVLVDDEDLHREGFNTVLSPLGITLSADEYSDRYLGFDDRGAFSTALTDHHLPAEPSFIDGLIAAKSLVYNRLAATRLRVFPTAGEILRETAEKYPVGIVSGALRSEIFVGLQKLNALSVIRAVVSAEDVRACKPDREGYVLGLRALRIGHPAGAVAVEDSPAGIQAALSAGLRVMAVAHSYPAEHLLANGAHAVRTTLASVTLADLEALTDPPER